MVFIFLLVFIMIVLGGKNHRSLSIFVRLTPFFCKIISKRVWRVDQEQFRYSRGRRGASIRLVLIDCVRFLPRFALGAKIIDLYQYLSV